MQSGNGEVRKMSVKPKRISLTSIAAELNLSVSAVSRVINNRTGVSEETRREVIQVLRQHNFKVQYPEQRRRRIAVVTEHALFSGYVTALLEGVYQYCHDNSVDVNVIAYEKHRQESLLSILRDQQCSGVIIPSPIWLKKQLPELSASGLPVMLINTPADTRLKNIGAVEFDLYTGSRQATEYLLAYGHRRIACYSQMADEVTRQRLIDGYLNAMEAAGIDVPESWHDANLDNIADHHMQRGYRAFMMMRQNIPEATAFMLSDDDIAIGALCAASEMGLRVPQDVSIVSLCGFMAGRFASPPLTAVFQRFNEAGRLAIDCVDAFLRSNGKTNLPSIMLPVQLEIRQSTGMVKPSA